MQTFTLSFSEAMLLGFCLEEYQAGASRRFIRCLKERLSAFVPSLARIQYQAIQDSELPDDIEWKDWIGYSRATPNATYSRTEEGTGRTVWDNSRRSLITLIVESLEPVLALDNWDRVLYVSSADQAKQWFDLCSVDEWQPNIQGADSVESIKEFITRLIAENEAAQPFEIGCLFGQLVIAFRHLEVGAYRAERGDEIVDILPTETLMGKPVEYFSTIQFHEARRRVIEELLKRRDVQYCHHAQSILTNELWRTQSSGTPEFDVDGMVAEMKVSLPPIWLAIGSLLEMFSRMDTEAKHVPEAADDSRMFLLRPDSTADRIRGAISQAEETLRSEKSSRSPESIVTGLAPAIEALAKRAWMTEFPTDRNGRRALVSILDRKRSTGTDVEKRFARIAQMMYDTYRNPSAHDFDRFQCSWTDARFFVTGVRNLLEISDLLVKTRR